MIFRIIDQTELEKKIEATPTGPERNALCDFNIRAQSMGKEASSVFVPTIVTDDLVKSLDDMDYYYVVTSGGYRESWKGFYIKNNPTRIQSILIEQ